MQSTKSRNGSSSPNRSKNPKSQGSKTTDRTSPRGSMSEKKNTSKVSELESQLAQFQEELKKTKDQLSSSEAQKKRAQQEAEEAKKQISSLSAKLEDSRQQLIEFSDSEDARLQELRKISHERDKSWQSELEALQKQHAADSIALQSAMNEILRLKKRLEIAAESEAMQSRHAEAAHEEIQSLRIELSETLELVEKMKHQLTDAKESESHAFEVMNETQMQLEEARSDSLKEKEAYNSLASELELSKAQVNTLEKLVSQLQKDLDSTYAKNSTNLENMRGRNDEETDKLKMEIDSFRLEVGQLKSALEASEVRYQNEYIQNALQIRNAYEEVECAKSETSLKEAAMFEELKKAKEAIEELRSNLASKQHEKEELGIKIQENNETGQKESERKKLAEHLTGIKSASLDKETQFQMLAEENEMIRTKRSNGVVVAEEGIKMKIGSLPEEGIKFAELLDVTQMEKAELEAELRRLKVQADQWRKAAEAAAAILSPDCDAKVADRIVSVGAIGMKMDSSFYDIMDDDSLKKKNANMLKKIGGLWKKGQKIV